MLTGFLTALAGLLAFFTIPAHTEEVKRLMYWHLGVQAASLLLFAWPAGKRWRHWAEAPSAAPRSVACLAALLLLIGSAIGGHLVYHGGEGIDPNILAPEVQGGHSH